MVLDEHMPEEDKVDETTRIRKRYRIQHPAQDTKLESNTNN